MKYSAICFDLDGTLYPKSVLDRKLSKMVFRHPVIANRYRKMRTFIRKHQGAGDIPGFDSMTLEERELYAYRRILSGKCSEAKAEKDLRNGYYGYLRKLYAHLDPQPEVAETLKKIRSYGLKTGVFSDWPLYDKLEQIGVAGLFDAVSCSSDSRFLKPDPRAYSNLVEKLGVPMQEILYVGDSVAKDVKGAKEGGMDAVLLYDRMDPASIGAEGVFEDWASFDRWIDTILKEG